jgi:murein DD-endopeptidase MepM/ murein hydrolase activator NlpD
MKIVKQLRQDAARLVGIGVAVGLSATSTQALARAAAPAQPDAKASSSTPSLSQSVLVTVDVTPILSPQLSAEIDDQIAKTLEHARAAPEPAAPEPAAPEPFANLAPTAMVEVTPAQAPPELTAMATPASLTHDVPGLLSSAGDASSTDGAIAFEFPLPGFTVNSHFGLRQLSFERRGRMHDGVDIAAPVGSEIHASADGTVSRTGLSRSYGRFVEIAHADGLTSFYAHMSRTARLEPGAKVSAGEVLGYVGSSGHSTGPHLHFEIRDDGKPLDPQAFMGRVFASAAELPLVEAQATAAINHIGQRVMASWHTHHHVLASWHEHGRSRRASYAVNHRTHARFAAL